MGVSSNLQSGLEFSAASGELVSSIGTAVLEIFLEALVIALTLTLAVTLYRYASSLLTLSEKGLKPKALKCVDHPAGATPESTKAGREVQSFVASVTAKGGMNGSDALNKYETLVRGQHLNLREHLADDHIVRSLYLALIEGAVSLTLVSDVRSGGASSSARPTIS